MEIQEFLRKAGLASSNSNSVKRILQNIGASRSKVSKLSLQPAQPVEQISWWGDSIFYSIFGYSFSDIFLFNLWLTRVRTGCYVCNKNILLRAWIYFYQVLENSCMTSGLIDGGYKKYALLSVKGAWSGDLRGATELQAELIELLR